MAPPAFGLDGLNLMTVITIDEASGLLVVEGDNAAALVAENRA